ncbi:MAG: M42 family metallopeptidase [Flavobacteriales bacterium]|jgi:putative aminopeptidase FrvX|tara:strand:- start:105 stop:1106 length:1002 start_codon:yes stop_codon:yes gene_type:complete
MTSYKQLQELVAIDSPSGYTKKAEDYCFDLLQNLGWKPSKTNKNAVKCSFGEKPTLAIAAHIDTLGAIVTGFNANGTLSTSLIGSVSLNQAEGEYVTIYTLEGKSFTGTYLLNNPAKHANKNLGTTLRSIENMHIRLDKEVSSVDDLKNLGIRIGDIICLDTRYQELESGFIKSRFMDNKAGCFVLFELARKLQGQNAPVEIFFSNYEEVGHGGTCGYADTIEELLVIDMGVIGDDCEGTESKCSICAKDSTGPYDYEMRKKLTLLAEQQNIPHQVDVFPYYGSDGSAALRAGNDFRVALIGPGVSASHGVERTHKKGIEATIDLCMAYIKTM